MAELADAHGSGPCARKGMEVRVLLSAPQLNGHPSGCPFNFMYRRKDSNLNRLDRREKVQWTFEQGEVQAD